MSLAKVLNHFGSPMFRRERGLECPSFGRKRPSGAFFTIGWRQAVSPSLGQAKLELVLHSDFCTMDNCSGSFPCCKRWEAIRHQLGRLGPRVLCCGPAPSLSQEVRKRYRNGTDSASMGVRTD